MVMKDIPDYENLFVDAYEKNNVGTTLSGNFLQKSHALLEKTLPSNFIAGQVLEVGAGSGHHFSFIKHPVSQYVLTDSSDAMLKVASARYPEEIASSRLLISNQDATHLEYPDQSFDRLIATHVLEHIPNPVAALQEWDRVVKKGGLMSIVLPCDPGLLWRFGRFLGPRRNARKLGLPYDYVMAADHVNSIFNLVVFIRHHFESINELWYPSRMPLPDVNLFYVCHITK
jgi:phosphatidylethanolamine/phosphatidyl-N-methylethanolamine N-methyltransferase